MRSATIANFFFISLQNVFGTRFFCHACRVHPAFSFPISDWTNLRWRGWHFVPRLLTCSFSRPLILQPEVVQLVASVLPIAALFECIDGLQGLTFALTRTPF